LPTTQKQHNKTALDTNVDVTTFKPLDKNL